MLWKRVCVCMCAYALKMISKLNRYCDEVGKKRIICYNVLNEVYAQHTERKITFFIFFASSFIFTHS